MRIGTVGKRFVSWVASLALVLAALAPSLSFAWAAASAPSWMAVCSSSGVTRVQADAERQSPAHGSLQHCPSCALHAPGLALPPAPVAALSLLPLAFERPALYFSAPRTLAVWRTAEARGPPAIA